MEFVTVCKNFCAHHNGRHYNAFIKGISGNKKYALVKDRNEKGQIVIKNRKGQEFTLESTIQVDDWENEDIPATVSL